MADSSGSSESPLPRPFDASLFDRGTTDKADSQSFPTESPFMGIGDGPPPSQVESPEDTGSGSREEVADKGQAEFADPAANQTPMTAVNYFTEDNALAQSGSSFFDSFATAKTDEENLFSTPPTSTGATPLSPEGPGFNIMKDPLGVAIEASGKVLEAEGVNSETMSMDSTNLLADDEQKLYGSANIDTVSMDSTNLLSEEDKDLDQANESFEGKQETLEMDGESTEETSQKAQETTISLESPDKETSALEDTIEKASVDIQQSGEKLEAPHGDAKIMEVTSRESDHDRDPVKTSTDAVGDAPDGRRAIGYVVGTEELSLVGDSSSDVPTSSQTTEKTAEDTLTEGLCSPDKMLASFPPLMSSFSAPSGLMNPSPTRARAPFGTSGSQEGDDPFVAALRSSESDRRHDAWLPSEATQRILTSRSIALQGSEYVSRDQLTMPGVIAEEPQGDPVKELVYRCMGELEWSKRSVLTINHVTRDEEGLKRLLDSGCIRAAVDLTGLLLTAGGQGKGQSGLPSRHSPHLMQVWFTRISLLMKLQQFAAAEQELEFFGSMDKPDLFFEYYPDLYPGRKGSLVPFSFRVIHAELPMYVGKHQLCLDRLSAILSTCHKIIQNLEDGKSEYGQPIELSEENRKASLDLWRSREIRVLHSMGNCLVSMKEYLQAVNVFKSLIEKEPENEVNILCGIARVYLQLGDLKSAHEVYVDVEKKLTSESKEHQARIHVNRGFLKVAQNQYGEAYKHFNEALKIEPYNFMAINNISVCCLYLGRLKEALSLLENLVNRDSSQYLDESLIFNLCTLYELESSKSTARKHNLLSLISKYKGDGFNVSCLKIM